MPRRAPEADGFPGAAAIVGVYRHAWMSSMLWRRVPSTIESLGRAVGDDSPAGTADGVASPSQLVERTAPSSPNPVKGRSAISPAVAAS